VRQEVVLVHGQHADKPDRGHGEAGPAGPGPRQELIQEPADEEHRREHVHAGVDVLPPVARRRRRGCTRGARQLHHDGLLYRYVA
jgi:hypothetical protein